MARRAEPVSPGDKAGTQILIYQGSFKGSYPKSLKGSFKGSLKGSFKGFLGVYKGSIRVLNPDLPKSLN